MSRQRVAAFLLLAVTLFCVQSVRAHADSGPAAGNAVQFHPRLSTVPEPELPLTRPADPVTGAAGALGSGGAEALPVGWLATVGLAAFGLLTLGGLAGLLAHEPALRSLRDDGGVGLRWWWQSTKDAFSDRLYELGDWLKYEGLPWAGSLAKKTGLYLFGTVFEIANSLFIGSGGLIMRWMGRDPDNIPDEAFQNGRRAGAKVVEGWGYVEMVLGITGQGLGLLVSLTGIGAVVGVPAYAASAGIVAMGGVHVYRGRTAFDEANRAYRRQSGRSLAEKPTKLLTEEEVRQLLGPNASETAVQRFMAFQADAARKLGANLTKAKVAELYEAGLGPALERWISELPPGRALDLVEHYTGNRRLLAAIHENRYAAMLAENVDTPVLKVNRDVAENGADVIYFDRKSQRLVLADVKSSFVGSYFGPPETFTKQLATNLYSVVDDAEFLPRLVRDGVLTAEEATFITRKGYEAFDLEIVTSATASVTDGTRKALAERLHLPVERIIVKELAK